MAVTDAISSGLNSAASTVGWRVSTASHAYQSLSSGASGMGDALDNLLAQVPAMLLVFPSAKVPIPVATIPIMFNPEKLKFDKSVHWHEIRTAKRNAPTAR